MMSVKRLYEELKELMEEGLEDCQLYGVRSPLIERKYGKLMVDPQSKTKWMDVSDDENW